MSDIPIPILTTMSGWEKAKCFIGDLARPFAIIVIAAATASAIVAPMITTDKLTAAGLILAALFGAKTYEVQQAGKQTRDVAVAQATGSAPTK